MTEKEKKELDEKIDKMAAEIEKEMMKWEYDQYDERAKMEEYDKKINRILKEALIEINTPFCHYIKPDGAAGKEFMIEATLLRHCVGCNDEEQCWNVGQLKDLIGD